MPLRPFAGLGSWAAFTATPHGAMVMGDTVVFQDEVTPAMDAAFAHGLEVSGLHNHFLYDEPKVFFMHVGGRGEPRELAAGVKAVWDAIKKVRAEHATPGAAFAGKVPDGGSIDAAAIEQALGHKAQAQDGVVKVTIGREGTMHGVKVGGSMGLTTWAAFSGGDGLAAVGGDFIMTAAEVQPRGGTRGAGTRLGQPRPGPGPPRHQPRPVSAGRSPRTGGVTWASPTSNSRTPRSAWRLC